MPLDDIDAYVDQTAPLLGLTIDPAWKPRVATFVRLAQGMARLVEESGALEESGFGFRLHPARDPMSAPLPKSAADIAAAVRNGAVTASEITRAALARIENDNPRINAFTTVTAERALREADAVDAARKDGNDPGSLAGVPYAAKNLFDIEGLPTLAGSKINRARVPAPKDAVLIQRMRAAGAILLGGVGMGEYAYDFTGQNDHYGPARNPLDTTRMTGGSSGGSAAAVAAGMVPIALGSDTNGSIRVPSAFCGLYGLRSTYGRLPRTGSFPLCESIDTVGPFATSTADLARFYDVLQGYDAGDPACANRPVAPTMSELEKGADGLRIAIAGGYFRDNAQPEAVAALELAARTLGVTSEVDIPEVARARASAYLHTNAESSALHLERLRKQPEDFDSDTRDRFLAGALLPAAWYIAAQRFRRRFEEIMRGVFQNFDIVLAPSTPFPAPPMDQQTVVLGGKELLLRPNIGILTQPVSLIGLPIAAVPVYGDGPLPLGIQVIGKPWREDLCLRVARVLEDAGLGCAVGSEAAGPVINDPEVVAEISALFVAYDLALMSNDVDKLTSFFWDSPLVIRYGTAENLYGSEALRAFRTTRSTKDLSRVVTRLTITAFGRDFATANAEYRTVEQGRLGRQSQTWCRLPEGWRVVAAHVSLLPLPT